MPELPEVELFTRYFADHALEQSIRRVTVRDARILGDVRPDALGRALRRRRFTRVRRHGKHFFAEASPASDNAKASPPVWLHLHFGMSGDLFYYRDIAEQPRFARVVFDFDEGGHLAYDDMRLFGVVELTPDPDVYIAEHHLGPDPLDPRFTRRRFAAIVKGRRGAIKSLLMSQDVIAGVGNLYADETLFQTSIHPRRAVDTLGESEVGSLFTNMRRILRDTIVRKARGGDYPPRWLTHHREEGDRCPLCGGTIERTVVFGRTTYYCPRHQR